MKASILYVLIFFSCILSLFAQNESLEIIVQGKIIEKSSNKPLYESTVILFERTTEEEEFIEINRQQVDSTASYSFHIEKDKEYKIIGRNFGNNSAQSILNTKDLNQYIQGSTMFNFERNIFLTESAAYPSEYINISDYIIYFPNEKSSLTSQNQELIDKFIVILKKNPAIEISIEGHTDTDETGENKEALSLSRAITVINYLYEKGIALNRLKWKSYGDSQLKYDCPNPLNSRVEFRITKI